MTKGKGAGDPPPVMPTDVAAWFAGWRPPDADLYRLADSVNAMRKACHIERNPQQFRPLVSDLEKEHRAAVMRDLASLQKTLPKVAEMYKRLNAIYDIPGIVSPKEPYAAEADAINTLQVAVDAAAKYFPAPRAGAPPGGAQKRRPSGAAAPRPKLWPLIIDALGECIAGILLTAGRPASLKSPSGPLITALCHAIAATEGESPPATTLVSHFRRCPPRFVQNNLEY